MATVAIGVLVVAVTRHIGIEQAIHDAKQSTRLAGEGFVAHHIDDDVMAGDPAALRRLDAIIREGVLRDGIVRAKIWTPDARVIYSDEPRLIGQHFELDARERNALRSGTVLAGVSDLAGAENRFEHDAGKLLEVYVPIRDRSGRRLTFEAYHRFSSVAMSGQRLWLAFTPALLGGLALLLLITLPLAWSLAQRVRASQQQREALLLRALNASETERRVIAADLHDGVVQELVGAAYTLEAHADELQGRGDADAHEALRQSAGAVRTSVRALRTLLIDIYPPRLHRRGLGPSLRDLATVYSARGLRISIDVPEGVVLDDATERLLFRCAQETLRNTYSHARATTVNVAVYPADDHVAMHVVDDGVGFDASLVDGRPEQGHFGLNVVRDFIADAGGCVSIRSAAPNGTHVQVQLPTLAPVPHVDRT